MLYRSMRESLDGLPELGPTARSLGARTPDDLPVIGGNVSPRTGGVSTAPDPAKLPAHRRPVEIGGFGKDPVWVLNENDLPPGLAARPDPANPGEHIFIEPAVPMKYDAFVELLERKRASWRRL